MARVEVQDRSHVVVKYHIDVQTTGDQAGSLEEVIVPLARRCLVLRNLLRGHGTLLHLSESATLIDLGKLFCNPVVKAVKTAEQCCNTRREA